MIRLFIIIFLFISFSGYSQNANEHNEMGLNLLDSGDYVGAIKEFNKAIFKDYRIAEYYYNRGNSYLFNEHPLKALIDYNKAIKSDPNVSIYYTHRGLSKYYADKGRYNYERYLEDYNKAIQLDSTFAENYIYRGFCWYKMKKYRNAILDYTKFILMDTTKGTAYFHRGLARIKYGDNSGCDDLYKSRSGNHPVNDTIVKQELEQFCIAKIVKDSSDKDDTSFHTNPVELMEKIDSMYEFNNFHSRNELHIGKLGKSLFKLPINECLCKQLRISITIDKHGKVAACVVVKGTSNDHLDSLIVSTIKNFPGEWTPMKKNGLSIIYSAEYNFGINNIRVYESTSLIKSKTYNPNVHSQVTYYYKNVMEKTDYNYTKKCDDNEYYYRKGIEEFANKRYKMAKISFTKALESNIHDLESRYNLGITYLRLEKIEKACEQFKLCSKRGDIVAQEKVNKLCEN